MTIITSSMHKDAIIALRTIDHQLAKDVRATDYEVNRFHLYIIRQLKTAIQNPRIITAIELKTPRDCLGYRLVTKMVERTADHVTCARRKRYRKSQQDSFFGEESGYYKYDITKLGFNVLEAKQELDSKDF